MAPTAVVVCSQVWRGGGGGGGAGGSSASGGGESRQQGQGKAGAGSQ